MHLLALLMASTATILFSCAPLRETISPHPLWVSAYYAGWMQGCGSAGHLRPEQIDYSAVTHIFHFAALPNSDGSIDCATKCLSPENSYALVNAAHAAGKKVLISVGGWLSETQFSGATNEVNRTRFITSLIDLMTSRGYDGIDIDWEPLSPSSIPQYSTFIVELRAALNKVRGHPVLTAAVKTQSSVFAKLQDKFDQINIMTYALSGPRPGWITWHNAPLYNGGYRFPLSGRSLPSADGMIKNFISAGIRREKLGIGIPFFGFVWSGGEGTPTAGATAPGQKWGKAPSAEEVPYYVIMDKYYHPDYYRWDEAAKVPYLSIDNAGSSRDKFISYDDERSCREKIKYVREKGLGGVMIFELGGGWRATSRSQDSLLKTVKKAVGDSSGAPAGKK
jgi:chitinase